MKRVEKVKWEKGSDFMDGSPRYTFGGRDPQDTLEDISVVIYATTEFEFHRVSETKRRFYYAYVCHRPTETVYESKRIMYLKDAKIKALEFYNDLVSELEGGSN